MYFPLRWRPAAIKEGRRFTGWKCHYVLFFLDEMGRYTELQAAECAKPCGHQQPLSMMRIHEVIMTLFRMLRNYKYWDPSLVHTHISLRRQFGSETNLTATMEDAQSKRKQKPRRKNTDFQLEDMKILSREVKPPMNFYLSSLEEHIKMWTNLLDAGERSEAPLVHYQDHISADEGSERGSLKWIGGKEVGALQRKEDACSG